MLTFSALVVTALLQTPIHGAGEAYSSSSYFFILYPKLKQE